MDQPVRIPVDIDLEDRLIGRLTARQAAILAAGAVPTYLLWTLREPLLGWVGFGLLAVPLVALTLALAFGRYDGVSLDRLTAAAVGERLTTRTRRPDPDVHPDTGDLRADTIGPDGTLLGRAVRTAPPARVVRGALAGDGLGVVEVHSASGRRVEALAVVAEIAPVNLALRSPGEQDALIAGLGRWLHTLTAPVQLLARRQPVDLAPHLHGLRDAARRLPPVLGDAALDHAVHLTGHAGDRDATEHRSYLVFTAPTHHPAARTGPAGLALGLTGHPGEDPDDPPDGGRRGRRRTDGDGPTTRAVENGLRRRLAEAHSVLGAAGITLTILDAPAATDLITHSTHGGAAGGVDRAVEGSPAVRVGRRWVRVNGTWSATLVVTGFPFQAGPGWLAPLSAHPGLVDVAVHLDPIPPEITAGRLRRRLARLESGRRVDADQGRLADPQVEAAAADVTDLAARVAQGQTRLFTTTVTLTVSAPTPDQLEHDLAALAATAASMQLTVRATSYRALAAWHTSLPIGRDRLGQGQILDTDALATAFPFASADLPRPPRRPGEPDTAVLLGDNLGSQGLVWWDRFGQDNYNEVILGRSGAGKSYLAKLELLRSLYTGARAHVIDPEDEYTRLARAVDATIVRLGAPGVRVNPLDLDVHTHPITGVRTAAPDALTRRRLHLHTVVAVLLGVDLDPTERAVLDDALTRTYRHAGITDDPATWLRPAPLLADLHTTLDHLAAPTTGTNTTADPVPLATPEPATESEPSELSGPSDRDPGRTPETSEVARSLAIRLRPFVSGAFAELFAGPTTTAPVGALVVWSLRELPDELKAAGTVLCLDAIWRQVTHPHDRARRLVLVDEAWLLMAQTEGARFLLRLAKGGRKHWAGLTLATQDTSDVLGSDLGRAVVSNASTQILLGQAPQAIDQVASAFGLTDGERRFLLTAARGQALLAAGNARAVFRTSASRYEDHLASTTPAHQLDHPHQAPSRADWIALDAPAPPSALPPALPSRPGLPGGRMPGRWPHPPGGPARAAEGGGLDADTVELPPVPAAPTHSGPDTGPDVDLDMDLFADPAAAPATRPIGPVRP